MCPPHTFVASCKFCYVVSICFKMFLISCFIALWPIGCSGVYCLISIYLWIFQFFSCYWFLVSYCRGQTFPSTYHTWNDFNLKFAKTCFVTCHVIYAGELFHVINLHTFISAWRTPLHFLKLGLVVMNSLNFCLSGKVLSLHFWKTTLLHRVFLVGSFFLLALWMYCPTLGFRLRNWLIA